MRKILLSIFLVGLLVSLIGCEEAGTPSSEEPGSGNGAGIQLALSAKQRVTSPSVGAPDLTALVDGNSAFAFDLYKALSEEEGNLFFSPYSISQALAMTYAGARGETEQQMQKPCTSSYRRVTCTRHSMPSTWSLPAAVRTQKARTKKAFG